MCPDLTIQLGFDVRDVARTLPDNSLDSQAQLLRYIVQFIRTRGLRCTYWFKDKTLDEMRAALNHDPSFSAAVRICADKAYTTQYAESLFQIIRYVCRRPPTYRSCKSVRFAESVQTIEPQYAEPCPDPNETPALAPFIADDLMRLHDPFYPDNITHIMLETAFCIKSMADDPDTEVHVVRRIFDILLEKKLVSPNFVTALDTAGLRAILQNDPALWETLRSLRELLHRDTSSFYDNFSLIIRYLGRSMRS